MCSQAGLRFYLVLFSGILGAIVLLVLVSSCIDLFFLQQKRNDPMSNSMKMTELDFHDNNAYVDMPESSLSDTKANTAEYSVAESDRTVDENDIKPEVDIHRRTNGKAMRDFKGTLNMSVDSDLTENNLDQIEPEVESKTVHSVHFETFPDRQQNTLGVLFRPRLKFKQHLQYIA